MAYLAAMIDNQWQSFFAVLLFFFTRSISFLHALGQCVRDKRNASTAITLTETGADHISEHFTMSSRE